MGMTSKRRLLTAIDRGIPDRLPVTTHHVMPFFLDTYMNGISNREFFDHFELDAIHWTTPYTVDAEAGQRWRGLESTDGAKILETDDWRVSYEDVTGREFPTKRWRIVTPRGTLTMETQTNEHTTWVSEHLIKAPADIDVIGPYLPAPRCDVEAVNAAVEAFGERGIVRGNLCGFDIYGQAGCWQDADCLVGTERLIMATYDDPEWVHTLLKLLQARKKVHAASMAGAAFAIIEHGGGAASTTVISPRIFEEFVAPYDAETIDLLHQAGQKVVYHTCGGMMPILEAIAATGTDAMETFTPATMGADVDLAEAKRRVGDRVCMIGGFDQAHFFTGCTPEETRAEVRRCFEAAGPGGGYILAPSDHFFDAEIELLEAFADEARQCLYD
jgi:uroporphyrinogen-III decarboxylase